MKKAIVCIVYLIVFVMIGLIFDFFIPPQSTSVYVMTGAVLGVIISNALSWASK